MKKGDLKAIFENAVDYMSWKLNDMEQYADSTDNKTVKKAVYGAVGAADYLSEKTLGKLIEKQDDEEFPTPPGVALTKGEAALLKSIFGNEIDTTIVKKYFAPQAHPYAIAVAVNGKKIKFYGKENHSSDYSATKDLDNYWSFVHEMTHVWQYQHPLQDVARALNNPTHAYGYELTSTSRFKDFGVEQQASIVADYTEQFINPASRKAANDNGGVYMPVETDNYKKQSLASLQKVVEDRFPEARKTRLALAAQSKSSSAPRPRKFGL